MVHKCSIIVVTFSLNSTNRERKVVARVVVILNKVLIPLKEYFSHIEKTITEHNVSIDY